MRYSRGGMIENPPFVVPVTVHPDLEELVPMFTGIALDIITQKASQNQARALFKQLMENDDNALAQLVQTIADLSEFYIFADNVPPNRVMVLLADIGQLVVNGFLAQAIKGYPAEFERYLDQDMARDVTKYLDDLNVEILKAQRASRGGGGGFGRGGGGGSRGWQPTGQRGGSGWGGGGRQRASRWDEDYDEQPTQQGYRGGGNGSRTQWGSNQGRRPVTRGTGTSIWDESGPRRTRMDVETSRSAPIRPARDFEAEAQMEGRGTPTPTPTPVRRHVEPVNPDATIIGELTFVPLPLTNSKWPKVLNTERPWDWILMEDGRQIRPAHQSDWKVSFQTEQPATPFYNPQTHILFHFLSADGKTVTEDAIQRNDTMGYLDHELDPHLRQKAEEARRDSEGKVAVAWQLVERLTPQPDSPLATDDIIEGDEEVTALVVPDEYMLTTSMADAIKKAGVRRKLENPDTLDRPFEVYVDRAVLTSVVEPDFGALYKLTNASDFRQVYQLLTDLPKGELAKEVNRRLTDGVNHALRTHIGLKAWSIDSFEEDIGDLMEALKEDYGPTLVNAMEENAIEIIARSLCHFGKEEVHGAEVQKLLDLPQLASVLIWRERASVTQLPVTADELVVPKDDGVLVSATNTPDFHRTISAIFNRTPDIPHVYHRRYLALADGQVYELVRGYLNDAATLMYKADFTV